MSWTCDPSDASIIQSSQQVLVPSDYQEVHVQGSTYTLGGLDGGFARLPHVDAQTSNNVALGLYLLNSLPLLQSWQSVGGAYRAHTVEFQSNNNAGLEASPVEAFPQRVPEGPSVPNADIRSAFAHGVQLGQEQIEAPRTTLCGPRKRKRKRDSNWTKDETSILVDLKQKAMREKGSRFCKGKPTATNWDAISAEMENKLGITTSSKTGDQCRLRWDTLVKSYQKISLHCKRADKEFSELTEAERGELRLATTISEDRWYEVIDRFCRLKQRKPRPAQKRNDLTSVGSGGCPMSSQNSPFEMRHNYEISRISLCEKQIVNSLVKKKLVYKDFGEDGKVRLNFSRWRVYAIFVKKVGYKNPDFDTCRRIFQDNSWICFESLSLPQRITTLTLGKCLQLVEIDLSNLPKLRCLVITGCTQLQVVTGWEHLLELGWLTIQKCSAYYNHPTVQNLPSLKKYFISNVEFDNQLPWSLGPGARQFVRLCRLEVYKNNHLKESGDLSSMMCLQVLRFRYCNGLSTIQEWSGLHSLTTLDLSFCSALSWIPPVSHMKALTVLDIFPTALEEIVGVEDLVSLEKLDCTSSKLKRLPDLYHLPQLQRITLLETSLVRDQSSIYFGKDMVELYGDEGRRMKNVEISDVSDSEHEHSVYCETLCATDSDNDWAG